MTKSKDKMNELKLLIVESPAKIKTISKFLGKDFTIMSTFGHIKDLPERKLGITINVKNGSITLDYVAIKEKQEVIDKICKQAKKVGEVYLASDPDREGEIISWHIGQEIEKVFKDPHKVYRITFNEITKPAVIEAIEHKTVVDIKKVEAQQARRILDRWVGYEVSPILWSKIAKGLSAGRVQSVAVMLICQREEEIKNFKPEESWSIHATFHFKRAVFLADLIKINNKAIALKNKEQADEVLTLLRKEKHFLVTEISEKKRLKNPLPPFMTSTLQQDAYNKLGFPVDKTMRIAQKLYEGIPLSDPQSSEALITYMRTDSLRISDTALKATRTFIKNSYGDEYLPSKAYIYGKEGAQDAHEAIRPINVDLTPTAVANYLAKDEAALYGLIWRRFVACQMSPAEYFLRQVLIEGGTFLFRATGSTLMFDGFLKVYKVEDEEEEKSVKIPKDLEQQSQLECKQLENKQHFTQPPARYSEATLVKELEKRGIGRPSTYAAILSTIQKRKYVEKDKKRFFPTELGVAVNDMLVKNLPDIINVTFTAKMEEDLDKIAQGDIKRDAVLLSFYNDFQKELKNFGDQKGSRTPVQTDQVCPECGNILVIRIGKTGQFLGCSHFPTCTFSSNFTRDEERNIVLTGPAKEQVTSDIACPHCNKQLVQKVGRFGPFLSCPGYPECKYIHQESLKSPCPSCGSKLTRRRWKGGNFWGCSGYPQCKFALFGEVVESPCPQCSLPFLTVTRDKNGGEKYACSDKNCGYKKNA